MNPKIKNLVMSVLVLCIIAGSSGLLLGLVNKLTYIDPVVAALKKFNELGGTDSEFELIEQNSSVGAGQTGVMLFGRSKDEAPVFGLHAKSGGGFGGDVEYYIFIKDNAIFKILETNHKETYFDKLHDAGIFEKYYGVNLNTVDEFAALKYPANDDGLIFTGATLSSTTLNKAVNAAVALYKEKGTIDTGEVFEELDIDLTDYAGIVKVEKNENSFRFTTDTDFPHDNGTANQKLVLVVDIESGKITEFKDESDIRVIYKIKNVIDKTLAEIIAEDYIGTGATGSYNSAKSIMQKALDIMEKFKFVEVETDEAGFVKVEKNAFSFKFTTDIAFPHDNGTENQKLEFVIDIENGKITEFKDNSDNSNKYKIKVDSVLNKTLEDILSGDFILTSATGSYTSAKNMIEKAFEIIAENSEDGGEDIG